MADGISNIGALFTDNNESEKDTGEMGALFRTLDAFPHKSSEDKLEFEDYLDGNKWLSNIRFGDDFVSEFNKIFTELDAATPEHLSSIVSALQTKSLLTYSEFQQKHGSTPNLAENLDPVGFNEGILNSVKDIIRNIFAENTSQEELDDITDNYITDINSLLFVIWNFHKDVLLIQRDLNNFHNDWALYYNEDIDEHTIFTDYLQRWSTYFLSKTAKSQSIEYQIANISEFFTYFSILCSEIYTSNNLPNEIKIKINDFGVTSINLARKINSDISEYSDISHAIKNNIKDQNPSRGAFIEERNEFNIDVPRFTNSIVYPTIEQDDMYNINTNNTRPSYIGHSSVSKLATDHGNKGDTIRDIGITATNQVTSKSEGATPSVDHGGKLQEDKKLETTEYAKTPAGGKFGPFTEDDWTVFKKDLGQRESGNKYDSVNSIKYMGQWQFGAMAIVDTGYASVTNNRRLHAGNGWTGKDGIKTTKDWLSNKNNCQDKAMLKYTRMHYKQLLRKKVITPKTKKSIVAGYLYSQHLLGLNGPWCIKYGKTYTKGGRCNDANGTSAKEYYNRGKNKFTSRDGYNSPESVTAMKADGGDVGEQFGAAVGESTISDGAPIVMPQSLAAPKYPYNSVIEYEGGHIKEYDSTPGIERISEKHKTGTGYEIGPDGQFVRTVITDSYRAVMGNDYIIVHGNVQIVAHGDIGVNAGGDLNINAGNNINMIAGGSIVQNTGQDLMTVVGGQHSLQVAGDKVESIGGLTAIHGNGDISIDGASVNMAGRDGDINLSASENINALAIKETNVVGKSKTTITSEGDTIISAKGNLGIGGDKTTSFFGKDKLSFNTKEFTIGTDTFKLKSDTFAIDGGNTSIKSNGAIDALVKTSIWADRAAVAPDGSSGTKPTLSSSSGSKGKYAHKKEHDERQKLVGDKDKFDKGVKENTMIDATKTQAHGGGSKSEYKGYRDGVLKKGDWK